MLCYQSFAQVCTECFMYKIISCLMSIQEGIEDGYRSYWDCNVFPFYLPSGVTKDRFMNHSLIYLWRIVTRKLFLKNGKNTKIDAFS